eukprot:CAMPEP_0203774372 /NCGR_PEP_ID=MMETSP0099_2-20121227/5283_1 /ASSEMBLY_ACC=CAM_ASM_000209 /TAXON_ID=96639 /ORGANISM=" , Strain NY0313808BC1" /LENGTH=39 /DNA_ID= /DNA_START= /DNA_END= /DNA_ORIENTATION=
MPWGPVELWEHGIAENVNCESDMMLCGVEHTKHALWTLY